ncbi:NEDD8-activating enzyme E1 regulatory subunit AXR1-like isoform X2 [Wolffia australiana]
MAAETKDKKYDRQLRIWGDQGQTALEKANLCLLNCGALGSETLKNLVLGGVGRVTVVDGSKVTIADLGNNFLVDRDNVGESKAKCVCNFLQELNDAVEAKFVEESPETLIETRAFFFAEFTLVIATQLAENLVVKLDKICRQEKVSLVVARSYGLCGLVRISVKEHNVIDTKPDHFLDDLRLHNPWTELKQFSKSIDLKERDPVIHKHTPYIIILVIAAEEWAGAHGGRLPETREEKKEFKELIKSYMIDLDEENYKEAIEAAFKVSASQGIGFQLRQIIHDGSCDVDASSPDFWILVAALKEFIENEGGGEPPLDGSIPDMTSLTEYYINLQRIYQAKAETDCLAVENRVRGILKRIGRDPDSISKADIKNFCKNARKLSVIRYRTIEDEFSSPATPELQKFLADEDSSFAAGFYILFRAVDRFVSNYNRFPGVFDSDMDEDIARLKAIAVGILTEVGCHGSPLPEDLISEMCRFGAAEIHPVAAYVGGVASQEIIKLITRQFVPISGTFIFNGIDNKSQLLVL